MPLTNVISVTLRPERAPRYQELVRDLTEVPGSPDVGWVHIAVTPGADDLFRFEPRVVPSWPW